MVRLRSCVGTATTSVKGREWYGYGVVSVQQQLLLREENGTATELCRYSDYNLPPWDENKYQRSSVFYHILFAKVRENYCILKAAVIFSFLFSCLLWCVLKLFKADGFPKDVVGIIVFVHVYPYFSVVIFVVCCCCCAYILVDVVDVVYLFLC